MILTKLTFIFMQKGTTFINTCCFSFDLELTLVIKSVFSSEKLFSIESFVTRTYSDWSILFETLCILKVSRLKNLS